MRLSHIVFSVFLVCYGLAAPVLPPTVPTDLLDLSDPSISPRSPIGKLVPGQVVKVAPKHVSGLPILKKNGKPHPGASIPHPAIVTSVTGNKASLVPISHTKVSADHSKDITKFAPSLTSLEGHGFLGATTADLKNIKSATGKLKGKIATSSEVKDLLDAQKAHST